MNNTANNTNTIINIIENNYIKNNYIIDDIVDDVENGLMLLELPILKRQHAVNHSNIYVEKIIKDYNKTKE
jgi:hypothetical protein